MTSCSRSSATSTDSDGRGNSFLTEGTGRSLTRILLYYGLAVAAVAALIVYFPGLSEVFSAARFRELAGTNDEITRTMAGEGSPFIGISAADSFFRMGVAAISMVGALALMIPVAWSYIVIKRRGGYDQSIVHTLLILPVAVTGIVMIVQNDLALAFSLAGIVAAVRFRTTLDDTKDAVYVFLAIAVGLASGVQMLGVAAVISVVFNAVNLTLWKLNFGNIYADQGHTSPLALGDILAGPGSAERALTIGDKALLAALSPQELKEAALHVARLEKYLEAETDTHKERKSYNILMVHTDEVGATQELVEREIGERSIRWRLAEILPGRDGVQILEYLVRLKDHVPAGSLVDAIRKVGGKHVKAAEFRSLEGLKRSS